MILNYQQALVPYATGTIQMVPGVSGYVPSDQGRDSGHMELAYSSSGTRHKHHKIQDDNHNTTYSWNRRPASYGMTHIGSYIDIYA